MENKSLLLTLAVLIFALSSMAQPKAKSDQPEILSDPRDGKMYKTVKIGTQTWMAENLAYKATSGCWANNDEPDNINTYGYLYNWYTAKTACPTGWHLPADSEWQTLIGFIGGKSTAGDNLKETGTSHWEEPNSGAANLYGFSALPGGYRNAEGEFSRAGTIAFWWSSSEALMDYAFAFKVEGPRPGADTGTFDAASGYSVRCIKD